MTLDLAPYPGCLVVMGLCVERWTTSVSRRGCVVSVRRCVWVGVWRCWRAVIRSSAVPPPLPPPPLLSLASPLSLGNTRHYDTASQHLHRSVSTHYLTHDTWHKAPPPHLWLLLSVCVCARVWRASSRSMPPSSKIPHTQRQEDSRDPVWNKTHQGLFSTAQAGHSKALGIGRSKELNGPATSSMSPLFPSFLLPESSSLLGLTGALPFS